MMINKRSPNKNLFKSLSYALCGFAAIWQRDIAFRREIILSIFIFPCGLWLGVTTLEKIILIACWFLVLIVEAINSSIENIVDRISLEDHPLSKDIKDISAFAVLLTIISAVVIWAIVLVG